MSDPHIEHETYAHIPRAHEVHANPDTPVKVHDLPECMQKPVDGKSAAKWAYERLILYIRNFEEQLDASHEVAMGFAGSDAGVMKIEGMGYFDPDIVTFYGRDANGTKTQLVQHVSQMSVILRAMPIQNEKEPPNRIGFRLASELD